MSKTGSCRRDDWGVNGKNVSVCFSLSWIYVLHFRKYTSLGWSVHNHSAVIRHGPRRNNKITEQLDHIQRRDVAELYVFYRCVHDKCSAELSKNIPAFVTPSRITRGAINACINLQLSYQSHELGKLSGFIYLTATKYVVFIK